MHQDAAKALADLAELPALVGAAAADYETSGAAPGSVKQYRWRGSLVAKPSKHLFQ